MEITLREITRDNYEYVCELHIPDEQQKYLTENVSSLVESHYHDSYHSRAIYLNDEPVGFMMWVYTAVNKVSIWRFMVAHKHQGKGIGRQSLNTAIFEIKADLEVQEIEICYSPNNALAKHLYFSVGFKEIGTNQEGDEAYATIEVIYNET